MNTNDSITNSDKMTVVHLGLIPNIIIIGLIIALVYFLVWRRKGND